MFYFILFHFAHYMLKHYYDYGMSVGTSLCEEIREYIVRADSHAQLNHYVTYGNIIYSIIFF